MVRGRTPDLCWRLMDAQHWASPRLARRQRIFLVADFGGRRSHEILFKPRTMQSLPAFGGDCGLSAACGDRGSFIEAGRRVPVTRPFQCFRMRASAKERTETAFRNSFGLPTDPFPTLLAGGISPFAFWYEDDPAGGCVRFPTETECERLMGLIKYKKENEMKKITALIFALILTLGLVGCNGKTVNIDFPFEVEDVESVEMYHYDGVPASAEKKVVVAESDIKTLYDMFKGLSLRTLCWHSDPHRHP